MPIFVSHSSKDLQVVRDLARGLQSAGEEVWIGHDNLAGGEIWWDRILQNIRDATLFLYAISDASINSEPCRLELDYARKLLRPVLPVQVGELANIRINPVAHVQPIPYRPDEAQTGIVVLGAVHRITGQPLEPLPDPLPDAPSIPYAYLIQFRTLIENEEEPPTYRRQLTVIERLQRALVEEVDPSVRNDVRAMLATLQDKPWVAKRVEQYIVELLRIHRPQEGAAVPSESAPERPLPGSTNGASSMTRQPASVASGNGSGAGSDTQTWELPTTLLAPADGSASSQSGQSEPRPGAAQDLANDPAREGDPYAWFLDRMEKLPHWNGSASLSGSIGFPPSTSEGVTLPPPFPGVPTAEPETVHAAPANSPPQFRSPPPFRALGVLALVGILPGILALYFSHQVEARFASGNIPGAEAASKAAKGWGVAGIVLGVLIWTILTVYWTRPR